MDRQCATEGGARFLYLSECVERAGKLGVPLKDTARKTVSPIGVITAKVDYENATLIYNATSGRFKAGHIAQMGATKRRG